MVKDCEIVFDVLDIHLFVFDSSQSKANNFSQQLHRQKLLTTKTGIKRIKRRIIILTKEEKSVTAIRA